MADPVRKTFPTDPDVGDDIHFEQCSNSIARAGKDRRQDVGRLGPNIGRLCGKHSPPMLMLMM